MYEAVNQSENFVRSVERIGPSCTIALTSSIAIAHCKFLTSNCSKYSNFHLLLVSGWEKVKHAVSRKNGPEFSNKKGYSEFYTELTPEDHEALAAADSAVLTDKIHGSEERIGGRPTQKRYNGM